MFSYRKKIDRAYASAPAMEIDDGSKIVIMSDSHRGSGNVADDFGENQNICCAALKAYNKLGYTYIELGDGDELWKNKRISEIKSVHGDIFQILTQFYASGRLWLLYGNHDMEKKCRPALFDTYYDMLANQQKPLFPGAVIYESLLLRYEPAGKALLLIHGHQADFFNNILWRLARFLVRHVWQRLELIGISDPISAAKNNNVKLKVEKRLTQWTRERGVPLIAGHTHRPIFPEPAEGKYFNDGCCVHPWNIVAIEIESGSICLVKWRQMTRDDGTVYVGRDVIAGPKRLAEYL